MSLTTAWLVADFPIDVRTDVVDNMCRPPYVRGDYSQVVQDETDDRV